MHPSWEGWIAELLLLRELAGTSGTPAGWSLGKWTLYVVAQGSRKSLLRDRKWKLLVS